MIVSSVVQPRNGSWTDASQRGYCPRWGHKRAFFFTLWQDLVCKQRRCRPYPARRSNAASAFEKCAIAPVAYDTILVNGVIQ
jgi:hypothetical protein